MHLACATPQVSTGETSPAGRELTAAILVVDDEPALNQSIQDSYTEAVALSAAKDLSSQMLRCAQHDTIPQRLTDLLQAQGVVPYTSAGQPFDPTLHEAVDVIKTDQATSGVVLDELSHGYRWGDEVLRPARVRVAQ